MNTSSETRPAGQQQGIAVAILAMIGSAACWGFATVMSRDLLSSMSSARLLVIQLAGSVLFLLVLSSPNYPWRFRSRRLLIGALVGVLEPGLTYAVGLVGLSMTTAGSASVISATEPMLIVIIAWFLLGEPPGARVLASIATAVGGVALVSWTGLSTRGDAAFAGDALVVLATLSAASYVVLSGRFVPDFPVATLASAQQIVGLVFAIAVFAGQSLAGQVQGAFTDMPPILLGYAALSGIVQYALAFWLYLKGLKSLSASAAGLWLTLVPVFGLFGAWVWLGELPSTTTLAGAALIVAAVISGNLSPGRKY